jgi:hypothetical protein
LQACFARRGSLLSQIVLQVRCRRSAPAFQRLVAWADRLPPGICVVASASNPVARTIARQRRITPTCA